MSFDYNRLKKLKKDKAYVEMDLDEYKTKWKQQKEEQENKKKATTYQRNTQPTQVSNVRLMNSNEKQNVTEYNSLWDNIQRFFGDTGRTTENTGLGAINGILYFGNYAYA